MNTLSRLVLIATLVMFSATSCSVFDTDSESIHDHIQIDNEESEISGRFLDKDTDVAISSAGYASRIAQQPEVLQQGNRPVLTLVAEIDPPEVNGETLQATMVDIFGSSSRAAAGYNNRGDGNYEGAIDILQITPGGNPLRLRSGIRFSEANVNAVRVGENRLWAAHASNHPQFVDDGEFSALTQFEFSGFNISEEAINQVSLPGFAANSLRAFGGTIYATSGDNAGLSVYSDDLSDRFGYFEIEDARWVDRNANHLVVLRSNELWVYAAETMELRDQHTFPGADTPEAKNTVELAGDLAVIAAGGEGTHIMNVSTGEILETIPAPDAEELDLSDSEVQTNAASVDNDLIFISNGEAGVYVAQAASPLAGLHPEDELNIEMLGQLQLEDLASVNHITYRQQMLAVAAGLGGIKMVRINR